MCCCVFFSWTVLSPHFEGAQMFPTVLENKESSRFYSFLWSFYDVCGQINSWDVDTVLSVASACTATHTSALLVTGSFFFFFFFKGESRSQSLPPFPAGIKGLSSTCDPGNTFTRPGLDRHGNRHSNLPSQALAPARTLASSSSFCRWEVFVVGVGGARGVGCCCPEVVFCG